VKWGAMAFLLKASRESRGKKKLKHFLILACRTLAILALVFVVARPLAGRFFGWGSERPEAVFLILDRSATMELRSSDGQPTKRQRVLERVPEALSELGGGIRLMLLDSATGVVQEVPSPEVLPTMTAVQATDAGADMAELMTTAVDYLGRVNPGRTEIWVASDLQEKNWKPADGRWQAIQAGILNLPVKTGVRVLGMTGEMSEGGENRVLNLLGARRVEDEMVLDLEVKKSSVGAEEVPVTVTLNQTQTTFRQKLSSQVTRFRHRLPLKGAGARAAGEGGEESGFGVVSLAGDMNVRDDLVYFIYGSEEETVTTFVTEETSGEGFDSLRRAAAPGGDGVFARQRCEVKKPSLMTEADFEKSALVMWQAAFPDDKSVVGQAMLRFIEKGGRVLFLPESRLSEGGAEEVGFLGMRWMAPKIAAGEDFFSIESWDRVDGPLRDGVSGGVLPLEGLRAIRVQEVSGGVNGGTNGTGGASGLALGNWGGEGSFLRRYAVGKGQAMVLTTLPDYEWSNLEQTGIHLVVVQRMIEGGMKRFREKDFAEAGRVDKGLGDLGERMDTMGRVSGDDAGDRANAPYRAGVYRLAKSRSGGLLAVNRAEEEGDELVLQKEGLDRLFEGVGYSLFEDESADAGESLLTEVWRPFVVIVLLALLVEAALCLNPKREEKFKYGKKGVAKA